MRRRGTGSSFMARHEKLTSLPLLRSINYAALPRKGLFCHAAAGKPRCIEKVESGGSSARL